jgi:hypothetical protein
VRAALAEVPEVPAATIRKIHTHLNVEKKRGKKRKKKKG